MTQPAKREICGTRHHGHQGHVFATNAATNGSGATNKAATNAAPVVRASNSAGFPKESRNGNRASGSEGHYEVAQQRLQRAREAMAKVVGDGAAGIQRGLQRDDAQPVVVSASEAGKAVSKPLENDGVERSVDCGGLSEVTRNRRSRAAYNAYQREYMRKRRAAKA